MTMSTKHISQRTLTLKIGVRGGSEIVGGLERGAAFKVAQRLDKHKPNTFGLSSIE